MRAARTLCLSALCLADPWLPSVGPADCGRCFYQMQMPDHDIPLLLYSMSLARAGPHPITFYNIGLCHKEAGRDGLAVSFFDKSIALDRKCRSTEHTLPGARWLLE